MYRVRIPIGILLISFLVGVFYLDSYTQSNYASSIIIALFTLGAMWEFYSLVARREYAPYTYFALTFCALAMGLEIFQYQLPGELKGGYLGLIFVLLFIRFLFSAKEEKALENCALTLTGIIYVYYFLGYLISLRGLGHNPMDGIYYLMYVVFVSKSMDIGGYMVGVSFGKHRISPDISPKKSLEGTIGGLILTVAVAFLLRDYFPLLESSLSPIETLSFALIMGLFSLFGDLSESLVKRRCNAKDSNQLIPEFGGILDLVDSLVFTAPLAYYLFVIYSFS